MDHAGGLGSSFVNSGVFRLDHVSGRASVEWRRCLKLPAVTEVTDSKGRIWFGYTANRIAMLDGTRVPYLAPAMAGYRDVISIYEP